MSGTEGSKTRLADGPIEVDLRGVGARMLASVRLRARYRPRVSPHTADNDAGTPRSLRLAFVLTPIAPLPVGRLRSAHQQAGT